MAPRSSAWFHFAFPHEGCSLNCAQEMSSTSTGTEMPANRAAAQRPFLFDGFLPVLALLAAASLLVQHGFILGAGFDLSFHVLNVVLAIGFASELIFSSITARRKKEFFRARGYEFAPPAILLLSFAVIGIAPGPASETAAAIFGANTLGALYMGMVKLYLLSMIFVKMLKLLQFMLVQGVRPELLLAGSLLSLILLGTALLLMPRAITGSDPLSFVDAFFTATSASCVTGLLVRDIGSFSNLGQMVILVLFQIGALGIITFVAFISVFSSKTLPVSQMVVFRQVINTQALSDLKRRILGVFAFTFIIEAVGAVFLFILYTEDEDLSTRLKWSIWHAISAFCNAGIALHPDSLVRFAREPGINIVIMGLVVLGGMGFLVIPEVIAVVLTKTRNMFRRLFVRGSIIQVARLSVQSKLALRVSLWLTVAGTVAFLLLEWNHLLAEATWDQTALISLFHSVTIRTAGFNSVPIDQLRDATVLLLMILMSIGTSPVSVGGGIKTVTFGILLLALRSMLLSHERVEVFGRTIPHRVLIAALSVFVLYIMTAAIATLLLATFEPAFHIRAHLLETISALSTAGLSTGVTPQLSTPSKLLLCAVMFVGRIGPIAMVVSVFRARSRVDYEFPTEEVVVG